MDTLDYFLKEELIVLEVVVQVVKKWEMYAKMGDDINVVDSVKIVVFAYLMIMDTLDYFLKEELIVLEVVVQVVKKWEMYAKMGEDINVVDFV